MKRSLIYILCLGLLASCSSQKQEPSRNTTRGEIKDPDLLFRIAADLARKGEFTQAYAALKRADAIDSENYQTKSLLGYILIQQERFEDAEHMLKESVRLKSNHSAHINLAQLYISTNKWDEAIASANKALEDIMYFTPYEAYNIIGWAEYSKGNYGNAQKAFLKALKTNSNYVLAINNLGLTYISQRQYALAKHEYERAIGVCGKACPKPFIAEFYYRIGTCDKRLKKHTSAKAAFQKSIALDPNGPFASSIRSELR